jgi:trigger factor
VEAETCKKELVIEIPVDAVRREAETVTSQYARLVRIPGFRPGRAPRTIVQRRFRDDIRNEVVQSLLPKFFENAVKDQKWSVVGRPQFEDLKFEDDQPVTCKATFEVYPQVALQEYKGLEVEEEMPTVTAADVANALDAMRERAAAFEVVADRPSADDDYVAVSYEGHDIHAPEGHPVAVKDAMVHLGGKGTVAGFTDNLRGSKPGEVKEFDVTYPEDYPQKSLAGKIFRYRVEVQSIKKKVVPPLDNELAKAVSEFGTIEELRAKLITDLSERRKREVEIKAKQKLVEQLTAVHGFPVPQLLVEAQLDRKLERILTGLIAQGVDPRTTEVDWRKVREESKPEAEKEVRASLLLEAVADAEQIEVSEEELDELIREMAEDRRETPAAVKTRLTRDGDLGKIKGTRRNQKAIEFIYSNAKITRKNG